MRGKLYLAALLGFSAAASIPQQRNTVSAKIETTVTPEEVDLMDLYASYSASAICNHGAAIGDLVTCEKNCERVEEDGAIIVGSYIGEKTKFAAYIALVESRKQIIFVGRSSVNIENWATNVNTTLVESGIVKGGMFHGGFSAAWHEISHDVLATLKEQKSKHRDYDIIVTGASLGGAVATVAAAHIRAAEYKADLYTYGAPRVSNDVLADFITRQPGKLYRVTHGQDPVPRVPGRGVYITDSMKYRHVSPEYYLQGEPADPNRWPIEDIKVCKGNQNDDCISDPSNPEDWDIGSNDNDHQNYFGSLDCGKLKMKPEGPGDGRENTLEAFGYIWGELAKPSLDEPLRWVGSG
ncbi:unnamed protein product [Clonostachys rosea]|uniref:Fungal lipase-type domain-containing protein n=1 Tax=Bionectria ochroleuca TaxID=29856 RepID=A0ABY6V684_BIOOC|nr:unnamed protein product [Clonostachys rosea]